jgi:hypothetical protein
MARALAPVTQAAINSADTDKVFVALVTITHADLAQPIRLCTDTANTLSRGNIYQAWPMQMTLLSDEEGTPPRASIIFDNVDRTIIQQLRTLGESPDITIEVVRADAPDVVEVNLPNMRVGTVTYNFQTIEMDLTLDYFLTEPASHAQFDPSRFPGLF